MRPDTQIIYKCPGCGWRGRESDMDVDDIVSDDGEEWYSCWICPKCQVWWGLSDYEVEENPDG